MNEQLAKKIYHLPRKIDCVKCLAGGCYLKKCCCEVELGEQGCDLAKELYELDFNKIILEDY